MELGLWGIKRRVKSRGDSGGLTVFKIRLNNLSVANRVHIVEPQWNPAVESQAIARILRLGQTRAVTVVRYIMNKSVEQVGPLLIIDFT